MWSRSNPRRTVQLSELSPNGPFSVSELEYIDQLAEDMKLNGLRKPIEVSQRTGYILDGNHRLAAAKKLGWEYIDVVYKNPYPVGSKWEELGDWSKIKRDHPDAFVRSRTTSEGTARLAIFGRGRKKTVLPISFKRKNPEWQVNREILGDSLEKYYAAMDRLEASTKRVLAASKASQTGTMIGSIPQELIDEHERLEEEYEQAYNNHFGKPGKMRNPPYAGRWSSYHSEIQDLAGQAARGKLDKSEAEILIIRKLREARKDGQLPESDLFILEDSVSGIVDRLRSHRNPVSQLSLVGGGLLALIVLTFLNRR